MSGRALARRRAAAVVLAAFAPGYGCCLRCSIPWKFAEGHTTAYTRHKGCFPLCESCWSELAPTERLPFYEELMAGWGADEETRSQVYAAVMSGE